MSGSTPRRRWLRRLRAALLTLLAFAIVFPLLYGTLVPEDRPPAPELPVPAAGQYRVFVADWGYHTAIIVEQPPGWRLGPPGEEAAAFVEYAWGDRRFYYASDYRPHAVFATLVLPTESVLYIDGRPDPPRLGGARAVFVRTVDAATVHALLSRLEASAARVGDAGRLTALDRAPGYAGRFHRAHGAYLWTRNCNWWTVRRLAEAGLAGSARGVIVTRQVPGRLRGFTRVSPGGT